MDYQGWFVGWTASENLFPGAAQGVARPWKCFRAHKKIQRFEIWIPAILFYGASSQSNVLVIDVEPFININKYERKIKCSD